MKSNINKRFFKKLIFLFCIFFIWIQTSCRSKHADLTKLIEQSDLKLSPEKEPNIPISLWSPEQRSMAASYYFMAAEQAILKERNAKKALSYYETAYALDPTPTLGAKMLQAKAMSGNIAEALVESRRMVLLYPKVARLHLFYGQILREVKKFSEAAASLEQAIDLDPKLELAYIHLIDSYQNNSEHSKAIVVAREYYKHLPGSPASAFILARLLLADKQTKESLVYARRAYDIDPNSIQNLQIYALSLQLNHKTKEAVKIYEQLLKADPTDEDMMIKMLTLYREMENFDQALSALNELDPESLNPSISLQRVIILWELKRFSEASTILKSLADKHTESERLQYFAGVGFEREDKFIEALSYYEKIPKNSPLWKSVSVRILICHKSLKQYEKALHILQELEQSENPEAELFLVGAQIYEEQDHIELSLKQVQQGVQVHPKHSRLYFMKGVYEEKLNNKSQSIASMKKVIELEPEYSSALNFLGYLYAESGENLDEAQKLIEKALQIKPNDPFYLDSLAVVYFHRGLLDQAMELLQKALKAMPEEGVILEHIGDVLLKRGQTQEATSHYQKALNTKLDKRDQSRIQKKLNALVKP